MKIIDFMICSGTLASMNYVLVVDNEENVTELKQYYECSDDEIESMRDDDGQLDLYPVLTRKGYKFAAARGFYKD